MNIGCLGAAVALLILKFFELLLSSLWRSHNVVWTLIAKRDAVDYFVPELAEWSWTLRPEIPGCWRTACSDCLLLEEEGARIIHVFDHIMSLRLMPGGKSYPNTTLEEALVL